jgi:DNA (cytosine-5)-methyltransferase 1
MSKWKVGSLFAGVGGFDLGFEQTGKFETVWMSEWDRHAEAVLRRRFPNAKQLGDITKVDPSQLEPVDVVVGGFPCQDLSVAGKRAGLAGERSGLFHEFVRIVRGLPRRPSFVVVENVPGMLSSQQGRDFAVVLSEVAEEWGAVSVAWRLLDSQYFGVAQRRRRVFLVLDLAGERAQEVLALGEGSSRNPPSRVPAEQESPQAARGCPDGGRPCFSRHDQSGTCREVSVAPCLSAKADNCCDIPMVLEQQPFSPHGHYRYENSDQSATLQDRENRLAGHTHLIAQTFRKSARATSASDAETWVADEYANTLNTFDVSEVRATTVAVEPLVLSFPSNAGNRIHNEISVDISSPLKVGSSVGIPSPPAVAMRSTNTIVRRLTPDECCVLQGFPPDWNDGQADSHRYKQMGNAVTVTVARWIAERMARFL